MDNSGLGRRSAHAAALVRDAGHRSSRLGRPIFAIFGALLLDAGVTYELAARMTGNTACRSAVSVTLAAAFILVWLSLGVGIIGADGDPANLMYFGVLAVGSSAP